MPVSESVSDTPRYRAAFTAKNCKGVGNSLGIHSTTREWRIHNIVVVWSYLLQFKFFQAKKHEYPCVFRALSFYILMFFHMWLQKVLSQEIGMDIHVSWLEKTYTEEEITKKQKSEQPVCYVFSQRMVVLCLPSVIWVELVWLPRPSLLDFPNFDHFFFVTHSLNNITDYRYYNTSSSNRSIDRKYYAELGNRYRNDMMCSFSNFEKRCGNICQPLPFHIEWKLTNEFCFWVAQIYPFSEYISEIFFFPEKLSQGVQIIFFLNAICPFTRNIRVNFF